MATKERYINLFTDYGFKKIFGEEPKKNLLLDATTEPARFTPDQVRSYTVAMNAHWHAKPYNTKGEPLCSP